MGFYIALELPHPIRLMRPGSFFDGGMSANAVGIVATQFMLNGFAEHSPAFAEKYRQIYEYIGSHPETQKIHPAID